jgi:hypothetical protein
MILSQAWTRELSLRQPAEKSLFIVPFKPLPTQIHRRDQ